MYDHTTPYGWSTVYRLTIHHLYFLTRQPGRWTWFAAFWMQRGLLAWGLWSASSCDARELPRMKTTNMSSACSQSDAGMCPDCSCPGRPQGVSCWPSVWEAIPAWTGFHFTVAAVLFTSEDAIWCLYYRMTMHWHLLLEPD